MAFVAGHNTTISYDNAAGTPVDISAYADSISGLDLLTDMLDTTTFGDSSKDSIPGLKGGASISVSGNFDSTLNTQLVAIHALTSGASQTLKVSPAGTASGAPYISCETFLTSYNVNSAVADKVTFSATLQMTGAVTTGTN